MNVWIVCAPRYQVEPSWVRLPTAKSILVHDWLNKKIEKPDLPIYPDVAFVRSSWRSPVIGAVCRTVRPAQCSSVTVSTCHSVHPSLTKPFRNRGVKWRLRLIAAWTFLSEMPTARQVAEHECLAVERMATESTGASGKRKESNSLDVVVELAFA